MSIERHKSGDSTPEIDPSLIADVDSVLFDWQEAQGATCPEELLVREFSQYYHELGELPLGIRDVAKYDVCYEDGTRVSMWPRADTRLGQIYDFVSLDDIGGISIRPFVVLGSFISKEPIDEFGNEFLAHITDKCLKYAIDGERKVAGIDGYGLTLLITPNLCEDAYLVVLPVYVSLNDRIEEHPIIEEFGYSVPQSAWRVAALNTSGMPEQYLIASKAIITGSRVAIAQVVLPNGQILDARTYMNETDE